MWVFSLSKRTLSDGTRTFAAYSGNYGSEQDNPACTGDIGRGPLPLGFYGIGPAIDDPKLGPCAMRLTPEASTNTEGRSGFFLHGDSIANPGHASDGCICTSGNGLAERTYINHSIDRRLEIVL